MTIIELLRGTLNDVYMICRLTSSCRNFDVRCTND
jgi:hypothetical protein